ncbi:hypothetical protein BD289DRAFT_443576, partial [Coniella lustricola]
MSFRLSFDQKPNMASDVPLTGGVCLWPDYRPQHAPYRTFGAPVRPGSLAASLGNLSPSRYSAVTGPCSLAKSLAQTEYCPQQTICTEKRAPRYRFLMQPNTYLPTRMATTSTCVDNDNLLQEPPLGEGRSAVSHDVPAASLYLQEILIPQPCA